MTERVALPPGCYGLDMPGGKKYTADKPGSTITVEDHHAKQIAKSSNAYHGIVSGGASYSVGTRTGRRCTSCGFLAQSWSSTCPRCDGPTEAE
jgi:hypothetical protein